MGLTYDFFKNFVNVFFNGQKVSLDALSFENDKALGVIKGRLLAFDIEKDVDVNLQLRHQHSEDLLSNLVCLGLHLLSLIVPLSDL